MYSLTNPHRLAIVLVLLVSLPSLCVFGQGNSSGFSQQEDVVQPVAPFPSLTPELEDYLNKVLSYWEQSTANIQRYRCSFKRWQFDPAQTKADFHSTYGEGIVRYMAPDKGLFKVENLATYTMRDEAGRPQYQSFPNIFGEWWICDGTKIHNYDRTEKVVRQIRLPADMQGKGIVSSPLPFLFGVEAAKLKERFWIRPLPPPTGSDGKVRNDLVNLEVFPKYQADAVNYQKVHVLIDQSDFLPAAIVIFDRAWSEQFPAREHFEFFDRQKNFKLGDRIMENVFSQEFIPMEPPKDWKVIEDTFHGDPMQSSDRVASPNYGSNAR